MPKDLIPAELKSFCWDDENCEQSLEKVYDHVVKDAKDAIDWYVKARKTKKYGGLFIRGSAVVLVAAAGLLPLFGALGDTSAGWANPLLASVAVGLAAAMVAFDKFFGFSSAWMRFITAELTLRTTLEEFEMDWHAQSAQLRGQKPSAEQVVALLTLCKAFASKINGIIADETKAWVDEFKSSLSQLDAAVKAAEESAKSRADAAETAAKGGIEAQRPGRLNVEIVNIEKVKLPWKFSVDGGADRECHGSTAAERELKPGTHSVRVFAVVGDVPRTAERLVDIPANATADLKITV